MSVKPREHWTLLHSFDFVAIGAGSPPALSDGEITIDGKTVRIGGTANAADWEIGASGLKYTKSASAASALEILGTDLVADFALGDVIWMASAWNCPDDLNTTDGSRFMIGFGSGGQIVPTYAGSQYLIGGNQYDSGQMNIRGLADDVNGSSGEANLVAGSGTVTHLGMLMHGRQGQIEYGSPSTFPTRPGQPGMTRLGPLCGGRLPSQGETMTTANTRLYAEFAAFGGGGAWTGYLERLEFYRLEGGLGL